MFGAAFDQRRWLGPSPFSIQVGQKALQHPSCQVRLPAKCLLFNCIVRVYQVVWHSNIAELKNLDVLLRVCVVHDFNYLASFRCRLHSRLPPLTLSVPDIIHIRIVLHDRSSRMDRSEHQNVLWYFYSFRYWSRKPSRACLQIWGRDNVVGTNRLASKCKIKYSSCF